MPTTKGVCHQYLINGKCTYGAQCKFSHVASQSNVPQGTRHKRSNTSLANFFASYGTQYDESKSPSSQFYRLCALRGWDKGNTDREIAYDEYKDALTKQFNNMYGTNAEDLGSWQALCKKLRVDPIPTTVKECRSVVGNTHVNLVDLVTRSSTGVTIFSSVAELSEYTKETGKYFPRDNIHAGDLLKFLLRQILNPPTQQVTRFGIPKRRR